MEENTLQLISTIAQIVIALAALVASITIPLRIRSAQRQRETIDLIHAVRSMWVSIDSVVLQNDELIEIADSILDPRGKPASVRERKKKWIALMVLNAVYMDYLGASKGFHSRDGMRAVRKFLERLLVDDALFALTQKGGAYEDGFCDLCSEVRDSVAATKTSPM